MVFPGKFEIYVDPLPLSLLQNHRMEVWSLMAMGMNCSFICWCRILLNTEVLDVEPARVMWLLMTGM